MTHPLNHYFTHHLAQVDIPHEFFIQQPRASSPGTSLGGLISIILPNLIVIAGVVFFFLIVSAGFSLIIGAGRQKSPAEVAKAKAALTWGVVGFLLVIGAYFILQLVQTVLGVNLLIAPTF